MLFLSEEKVDAVPVAVAMPAADLAAEGGSVAVTAGTLISLRREGPFVPVAQGLLGSGPLRDELAAGLPTPSLRGAATLRWGVLAGTSGPMLMLLELDRELLAAKAGHVGLAHVIVDLILVATVAFELTRRTPRAPGIAAVALVAIALRWALVAIRLCDAPRRANPLVYVAAGLAAAGAAVVLARLPSPRRVALELAGKLGIARADLFAAVAPAEPSGALVAAAVACAAGLPAIVHVARLAGAGILVQGVALAAFGAAGPPLARRIAGAPAAARRREPESRDRIATGLVVGLALAAAAVTSARLFFESGTELARCVGRLDAEAKSARAAEASELLRAATRVRESSLLVFLTATVFPFAEERIYRGLLQDVLVAKFGRAYGVFAASIAFGAAHLGVYQAALYQTVLLGLGFGIAYAEGGLIAAFCVHATWNLLQLT